MLDALERLLRVQELDLEVCRLEEDAKILAPRVEQLDREAARRAEALKKLKTVAGAPAEKRRALELELKEAEARVEHATRQQEMVRTKKELEAANHEMEAAQSRVSALEEEILALLDREDELAGELAAQVEAATRTDVRARVERDRLATALEEKRSMVRDLREDRVVALNRLDEDLRDTYERLLKLHHGPPAVAELAGGNACGGCGNVLVPQQTSSVRQGLELVQCGRCFRYLYQPG